MRKVSKGKAAAAASAARQARNASAESDNESVDSRVNGESEEEEFQEKTPSKKATPAKRKGGRKASADSVSESESHANGDADDDDGDDGEDSPPKKSSKSSKKSEATKSSDDEEFEVEDVIDSKRKGGQLLYLIRWKGYSAANDTWEPESVVSCPKLLAAFNARTKGTKNKKSTDSKGASKRKSDEDGRKKKKKRSDLEKMQSEFDCETADEKAEYEVEKILEVHHLKGGTREFLIHWKGWSAVHDSWEPEKNLNCKDLIARFMNKVEQLKLEGPGAGGRISSGLRVAPAPTQRFTLNPQSELRRLSRRSANSQRVHYYNAE